MIWRLKWSAIRLQGWSRNQARRNRWRQLLKAPNTPSGAKTSVHVTRCTSHPTAEFSRLIWELGSLADDPERLISIKSLRASFFRPRAVGKMMTSGFARSGRSEAVMMTLMHDHLQIGASVCPVPLQHVSMLLEGRFDASVVESRWQVLYWSIRFR